MRGALLREWAGYISTAAISEQLTGKSCQIRSIHTIAGPRAGALEILAGLDAGMLLQAFTRNDCATLRQFIPWDFTGEPQVFMSGRYVRLEAGWPDELAEKVIRLDAMGRNPTGDGRWIAGRNEYGETIRPGLNDRTSNFLISGEPGVGKSVAMRGALLQLAQDPQNRIVLLDGKYGDSLRAVEHLPGVVGPCAVDVPQMQAALAWCVEEMRQRYLNGHDGRLVIAFDEFQDTTDDKAISDMLCKLTRQGRGAGVHCILATQYPTVKTFGDSGTRRAMVGKVALRVEGFEASRVAVNGPVPRADHLLGAGDSYTIAPGACHRVQIVYVDHREIEHADTGIWLLNEWPAFDAGALGQDLPERGWSYSGQELAASLVAAAEGEGRPAMVKRLDNKPGAERAIRLLNLGRETNSALEQMGYAVCLSGEPTDNGNNSQIVVYGG